MDQMRGRAEAGARRGYLTASIDCRYHGRRCPPGEDKRSCYEHALVRSGPASLLLAQKFVIKEGSITCLVQGYHSLSGILCLQGIAADIGYFCYHVVRQCSDPWR